MLSANPVFATLLALSVTLGLIWLAARLVIWGGKRFPLRGLMVPGQPGAGTAFLIDSITPIAPRRKVVVLRYGEHRLAVLVGGPQDVSLGWLPPGPPLP
jgi:hypothetical protein